MNVKYRGLHYQVEASHTERVRRWPRLPWPKRTVMVIDKARLLSVAPLPDDPTG